MMKKILLVILILFSRNIFSQKLFSDKLWVGNDNYYLLADSEVIRFETFLNPFGNIRVARKYLLFGDTLRIFDLDYSNNIVYTNFHVDTLQKFKLILTPMLSNTTLLTNLITAYGVRKHLDFTEKSQIKKDSIRFEKIVFNTTTCFGTCPSMTLEIDDKKHIKFIGREFANKKGLFYSTIPDSLFYELIEILKLSQLDKIESNKQTNIDLPTYTIEIYYNNKIKFLSSCDLPFITDELKNYLLTISKKITLKKSNEKFDIAFYNK